MIVCGVTKSASMILMYLWLLTEKEAWESYSGAVNAVLRSSLLVDPV